MKKNYGYFLIPLIAATAFQITGCTSLNDASITSSKEEYYNDSSYLSGSTYAPDYSEDYMPSLSLDPITSWSESIPQNTKLIRNISLELETNQFSELTKNITDKVTSCKGYIEQSNISDYVPYYYEHDSISRIPDTSSKFASITVRIPSESLDEFILSIEGQAHIMNKSESITDVTLDYTDIANQKKALQAEYDRLIELFSTAESLDSVILLEERLSSVRYNLESIESQLLRYDNQIDYSTVYISIREVTSFTPTQPDSLGSRIQKELSYRFSKVGDFLFLAFIMFIVYIPIWLPLVLVILIIRRQIHKNKSARKRDAAISEPEIETEEI